MGDKNTYQCGLVLCPGTIGASHAQAACPQPVRVEIKKLQIVERLSDETLCFACDVWVDGKKAGTAENDGHGGCTFVRWSATNKATADRVNLFGKTLCPEEYRSFTRGDEWIVDQLVNKAYEDKTAAKDAKRIARAEAKQIAANTARGMRTARFKTSDARGESVRWVGFKPEQESAAKAAMLKKYPTLTDWTVIS